MQKINIDTTLARRLIANQFPHFSGLPIRDVQNPGWDNVSFRLGENFLVRIPRNARYALQVEVEHTWLPRLAPLLPLEIPEPVALGAPELGLEYNWSIYRWIDGETDAAEPAHDEIPLAEDLARFLKAMWAVDAADGPRPGERNFHRGGALRNYDEQTRAALAAIPKNFPSSLLLEMWGEALETSWDRPAVWVHGDVAPGNIILRDGRLSAVIDFGQLAAGDPACDLAFAWRRFGAEAREAFRQALHIDEATWRRGRAWALWKAAIICAGIAKTTEAETAAAPRMLERIALRV